MHVRDSSFSHTFACSGGRYQTSQTSAQLVIILNKCSIRVLLLQNASANRASYCNNITMYKKAVNIGII